jgi:5-carboxymethyl-2-hydroxymuconate isomerase
MKTLKLSNNQVVPIGKIICLGRNYSEHAKEMKSEVPTTPILFLKPASAVIFDGEEIVRPALSKDLHHEVELVVVIGRSGKNVSESDAMNYVLGYGVGLDMTLRDVQNTLKDKGLPWFISKGFDTSAPLSVIIPKALVPDWRQLEIRCSVNGRMRQQTKVGEMIFSIEKMISYMSTFLTLEPGDLIFTGTPQGVGTLAEGDTITAELVGFTKISHKIRFDV